MSPARTTSGPAFRSWKGGGISSRRRPAAWTTRSCAARRGRYVAGQAVDIASALHPVNASIYSTSRTWNDSLYPAGDPRRQNYVPDCDLTNPLANGECGQIDNLNFGRNNPTAIRYANDVLTGWGHRGYNWQASAAFQHELHQAIALNVAYFRTW